MCVRSTVLRALFCYDQQLLNEAENDMKNYADRVVE